MKLLRKIKELLLDILDVFVIPLQKIKELLQGIHDGLVMLYIVIKTDGEE